MEEIECSKCDKESTDNIYYCPSCQTLVCRECFADQECITCITCEACGCMSSRLHSVGERLLCEDCANTCDECGYSSSYLTLIDGILICEDCDMICDSCGYLVESVGGMLICGCTVLPDDMSLATFPTVNTAEIASAA